MGRIRVIARLVARDLRRRRGEAVLMLITITAASAALTLGLILHGVTSQPYAHTRAATRGPDAVANVFPNGPPCPRASWPSSPHWTTRAASPPTAGPTR